MAFDFGIIIFILVTSADGGAPCDASPKSVPLPIVQERGYRGVVFPAPPFNPKGYGADGAWSPSVEDIHRLEALLPAALKYPMRTSGRGTSTVPKAAIPVRTLCREFERMGKAGYFKTMSRQLSTYRRQYAGITTDSVRTIVVNFFPESTVDAEDWHHDWRSEWVLVWGGGTGYWQVHFDVQDECFHSFHVNSPR